MPYSSIISKLQSHLLLIMHLLFVNSIIGKKHVAPLLIKLLDGEKMMTELSEIVSNYSGLQLLTRELSEENYISVREVFSDKRKFVVSLTPTGRLVAQKLKEANDIAECIIQLGKLPDKSFFSPQQRAIMYLGEEGKAILSKICEEAGCSSDDLRSLEDTGFITKEMEAVKGSPENFIVLTPKGILAERKLQEFAEEPRGIEEKKVSHESKR